MSNVIAQFTDTLYSVSSDLSERQFGHIMLYILKHIHDYMYEGLEPTYDDIEGFTKKELKSLLKVMRVMELCKSSEQQVSEEQKPRGRGAPLGNTNRTKGKGDKVIPETNQINSQSIHNQFNSIEFNSEINSETIEFNSEFNSQSNDHDHDHSFHLNTNDDHDHEVKMLEKIEIASKKLGISIEKPQLIAKKFLTYGIKSEWLFFQKYDFLDFVVFWLKDHPNYSKKDAADMRNLFISAVKWAEIRQKYPEWREKQEQKDLKKQKKAIRENYPEYCPHCSARMQGEKCPSCGGFFTFDESTMKHVFNQNLPFIDISHQFLRRLDEKQKQKTATAVNTACG
jgi:hypothetical protein